MASGKRAFAQKLNKRGAAEVRKQVSSAYIADLPKSISGLNLAAQNVPLCDVVEPPDFEDFLYQHQLTADYDPLRHLLEFPSDDLQVKLLRRKVRTIAPVVPEHGAEHDLHVKDCVKCYTSDYTTVNRKYQTESCQHWTSERDTTLVRASNKQEYEIDVEGDNISDHSSDRSSEGNRSSMHMNDTPRGSWASSIFDLRNSQADAQLQNLLDGVAPEVIDQANEEQRQTHRQDDLLSLYPPQPEEEIIEQREEAAVPSEGFGHQIHIKCQKLQLDLAIEPIFASMALYDSKERKKISENFYLDMNDERTKKMLGGHITYQDVSTLSRSALFSVTFPSPDIYIVIKLEKVLQQGDISEVAEPYLKEDKNKEKARSNAQYYCERFGRYRMPFAWTAISLMSVINGSSSYETEKETLRSDSLDRRSSVLSQYESFRKRSREIRDESFTRHSSLERQKSGPDKRSSWTPEELGSALDNFRPITLTLSSFFKQESDKLSDEDLYKFLVDMKKPGSLYKKKTIPGVLQLDISPGPDDMKYCLTPELYRIDPYPDDNSRPMKEVLEFPVRDVYEPYNTYRNLMYVYPKSLNFTNRQGSARNIAVKVQFMEGEDERSAMHVIFGKSSCPEYTSEAYATVTYHTKCPDFYEEVKMKLPARLSENHHLLFTFYHVSCQRKVDMSPQLESAIGYTWLPLSTLGQGGLSRLATGEFCLPVLLDRPPAHYSALHPDVQLPNLKWVDGHKGLFTVNLQAVSSIHTLDEHLDKFLSNVHIAEEQRIPPRIGEANFEVDLKRSVNDLQNAKSGPLIRFLNLVLDKLLLLVVRPPIIGANIAQTAFESIAQIVRRVQGIMEVKCDQHGRNALLTTYIQYACTLPHPEVNNTLPLATGSPTVLPGHSMTFPRLNLDLSFDTRSLSGDSDSDGELTPTSKATFTIGPLDTKRRQAPTGPGSYATLGRPVSLPVSKQGHHRSSSDPDLPSSNPGSPDAEVAGLFGHRGMDRNTMYRQDSGSYLPTVRSKKLVHEEMVLQWVVAVGSTRELALNNAWFFFELITKSMGEHLSRTDRLYGPRKMRFPSNFMEDVTALCTMITRDIIERHNRDWSLVRGLNNSLAFFINDLLTLMDRGFVFHLIKQYCKAMSAKISSLADATSPITLKLDFLRIVCSHEHYVPLNLPFGITLSPSAPASPSPSLSSSASQASFGSANTMIEKHMFTELSLEFRTQHFLTGLVLSDLSTVFETQNLNLHTKAIGLVRNLLSSHDADPRYKNRDARARVASLYLPLVGIVMDVLPQLYDPNQEATARNAAASGVIGSKGDNYLGIDQDIAMAIAGSSIYGTPGSHALESSGKSKKIQLGREDTRHLLICLLWVLKNVDHRVLRSWWAGLSLSRLSQLLDALYFVSANFEYKGKRAIKQYSVQTIKKSVDMKSKLEEAILGSGSARSEMMQRRRGTSSNLQATATAAAAAITAEKTPTSPVVDTPRLRWRKEQTQWKQTSEEGGRFGQEHEANAHVEGQLATECSMIVLDTLELIVGVVQNSDLLQNLLATVLRVLLHSLSLNQSTHVLQHMLATQRSLVAKFPELLFEEETELCADLCLRLLRHCSSPIANTRSHASASLYLLMRQNFEIGNNFVRVKMQVTMSLSSLVGQNQNFNEEYLRKSLKTILTYAEADKDLQETTFPDQVRDLVFNLHMILSDTVKMKEFQEDPEMLIDLMYRIAKGYQNSPDLRLTWLENMAAKHSERYNHAEAALCLIHSAGLVAEYLNMLEDRQHLPVGCVSFQHISRNVLEESAVSDDVVSPDEEGICTGKYFTELGLVGLLEQAASSFNMGHMYEAVNSVYKVLIPIYEENRDFKKLASVHGKLQEAFNRIVREEGKRMFGTYFRVGFYGSLFGDLDDSEFIYKEPSITKLAEISHRLEAFYSEKFGDGALVIIKDSNTVEKDKLNPEKAYIQITYVEPFFNLYEQKDRITSYDKNNNIRRFMYATPFTEDGRAHGELHDQYKRKTILTTSHAFPYIKTRLAVIKREQIILTPIEVAIEDIQKKCKELGIALGQEPPDTKMLQMVLQGCIGTTVNQGPLEIAMVFLGPTAKGEFPSRHHNKLRICFKDLLNKCADALHRNKSLIGPDQKEYHCELERNYRSTREKLLPFIASPKAQQEMLQKQASMGTKKKQKSRDREHSRRPKSSHGSPNESTA